MHLDSYKLSEPVIAYRCCQIILMSRPPGNNETDEEILVTTANEKMAAEIIFMTVKEANRGIPDSNGCWFTTKHLYMERQFIYRELRPAIKELLNNLTQWNEEFRTPNPALIKLCKKIKKLVR